MAGLRQALRVLLEASAPRAGETNAVRMFAGPMARTADQEALSRAQQLAQSGSPREQIWNDTGWFQGVDGKWRFEIDDSGADIVRTHSGNAYGQLDQGLTHPQLFDAYPEMRETRLGFEGDKRVSGSFRAARDEPRGWGGMDGTERVPPEIRARGSSKGSLRSTTLHEVQHNIQDTEGFARGGMPETAWGTKEQPLLNDIRAQMKKALGGVDPYAVQNKIAAGYYVAPEELAAVARWRELTRQEDAILAGTLSPREAYRRLAGEVESRNVQTRRNLTPAQRRKRAPWTTQDVPDEEQIVSFRGDKASSALGDALRVGAGLGGLGLAGGITLRQLLQDNMQGS